MAGVFTQIKEIYGYLVGEQRAVADFLQRCPELATQAGNQAELAELIGVEERNVLILIQSMGYLNFEQFQQELMDSLQRGEQPQREGTLTPLFGQVFGNAVQNLDRSQKMMYPKEMDRALKLMQQAHHLYLLGLRSSFTLAYYLHTRLCQVRQEVRLIHTTGLEYPEELVGITAGDVVVAFLFPHYSKITANLIVLARSRGAKVILIADENHGALEGYADVLLPCFVRGVEQKVSVVAPLALAEYLAEELAARNPAQSQRCCQEAEQLLIKSYELGL